MLILVWVERSLHYAQVSEESCPWPLKLMTSQSVERTWIRTGGYGRFRGEWVNKLWPLNRGTSSISIICCRSITFETIARREQHYWSAIDRHLLSRTAFPSSYSWNEAKLSVSGAWSPLKRGVNNGRTLFATAKSWPRPLNSGLSAHSFLQLFRAFDYWPLNRGWLLNRWPVDERLTELRTYQRQSSVMT